MKVYRFGISFNSKMELAAILGLAPYNGRPLQQSEDAQTEYLSEQDIINRLIRTGGCADAVDAVSLFVQMVKRYRDNTQGVTA